MRTATETGLISWVVDLDETSIYPSIMRCCQCSRSTMTTAVFDIEGKPFSEIQHYYANLIHTIENAEALCHQFHGLPSYVEMEQLIKTQLQGA